MGNWRDIDGHRIAVQSNGGVLWEHDTLPGHRYPRHTVAPAVGATWDVQSLDPLTLSPSLHCDAAKGGCGRHGFIRNGHWEGN